MERARVSALGEGSRSSVELCSALPSLRLRLLEDETSRSVPDSIMMAGLVFFREKQREQDQTAPSLDCATAARRWLIPPSCISSARNGLVEEIMAEKRQVQRVGFGFEDRSEAM